VKNPSSLTTPGTETAPLDAVDIAAIEEALCSAKALLDRVFDDDALPTDRALHWQLVQQLTSLQLEYQRIQTWLDQMQVQLSEREAALRRRLSEALALADQAGSTAPVSNLRRAKAAPALSISVLGRFAVRCNGQEISLGSSKAGRAIFRYLVVLSDRSAPTDVLLELFWPGDAPQEARHKLHIAVSTLRQALAEGLGSTLGERDAIAFLEDRYVLLPELPLELDVNVFAAHVAEGQRLERVGRGREAMAEYEVARACYQGDFLAQDLYTDWAAVQRARYEETYLTLLGRLAGYYLGEERYPDCVACCREILARDSFREDAYRQLMRCYARMGRRNQALREFQACREVLRWELGVSPMRETIELYDQIVRQESV
jgi:DNA-binding SARP family transcriptional activator